MATGDGLDLQVAGRVGDVMQRKDRQRWLGAGDEALWALDENNRAHRDNLELAEGVQQTASAALDRNDALGPILPGLDVASRVKIVQHIKDDTAEAQRFRGLLGPAEAVYASTSGTISGSVLSIVEHELQPGPGSPPFVAFERLAEVVVPPGIKCDAEKLLRGHGLGVGLTGEHSPLELHQDAYRKLDTSAPGRPAGGSLLPMRDCIDETLDILIRRCPQQEIRGSGDGRDAAKVRFVLHHLAIDGLSAPAVQRLAEQVHCLRDRLSDQGKRKKLERPEWHRLLHESSAWIANMLKAIDPSKGLGAVRG